MFNSLPLPTVIILHLLVAYVFVVAPFLSRRDTRKIELEIASGDREARLRLYRRAILGQGAVIFILTSVVIWGKVPPALVGLSAPYSWPLCLTATGIIVGLLVWSGLRLRSRAASVRQRLRGRPNIMVPSTEPERGWFCLLGFVAGLAEELLCRGFMFYLVQLWLPGIPLWAVVLLTSAAFGVAHLYQGARGVLATGIGGAILGLAYAVTGNLLLPILFHGFINARVAFLPVETDRTETLKPAIVCPGHVQTGARSRNPISPYH